MKPSALLMILFALLSCEKSVLSEEDQARNAVIEWVAIHQPHWHRQFKSAEKTIKFDDGVLVEYLTKPPPNSTRNIIHGTICYFVRSSGGSLNVEEGFGSPENEKVYYEMMGARKINRLPSFAK